MDKEDVICGLFSYKKEILLLVTIWMDLEGFMLVERSQTVKDKCV